jgi:hypothetical protein
MVIAATRGTEFVKGFPGPVGITYGYSNFDRNNYGRRT